MTASASSAAPPAGASPYGEAPLPPGIRSRWADNGNGLRMHLLEAGHEAPGRPLLLLLHGFPELAYSWRKVLLPLAAAGYHVVAPDQRGYGGTTGWSADYDGDLRPFGLLNLVRDALGLVAALGHREVAAVIGHDFGSPVAGCCALVRPDVFRSVVMMSAPFPGAPALPFGTAQAGAPASAPAAPRPDIHEALAALTPPRKHYQWYYSTRAADADMRDCPQGLHAFLRAYYHMKSADWAANTPRPLAAWRAEELAQLPTYYVMRQDQTMAETVAPEMPGAAQIAACAWLPDAELAAYSIAFGRTGFQGGLQWYRCGTGGLNGAELTLFSGRTVDVPAAFIAGRQDWGSFQVPGALPRLERELCTDYRGTTFVDGAGHWVQQEQPQAVARLLLDFLRAPA